MCEYAAAGLTKLRPSNRMRFVRLVGEEHDGPGAVRRRLREDGRERIELRPIVDASGRIVRRVDDEGAGARGDRGTDRVGVEIVARPAQPHAHRRRAKHGDHRFVEEPRRRQKDELVAVVDERPDRGAQRAKRPGREPHVVLLERQVRTRSERRRNGLRGGLVVQGVREPVLVLGHCMMPDRIDESRQGHLLRIAEDEVGDGRIAAAASVFGIGQKVEQQPQAVLERNEA